ncbi:MAG: c-type cytochrome [Sphingomonas sp.]
MRTILIGLAVSTLAVAGVWAADNAASAWPSWHAPAGNIKHGQQLAQTCLGCHGATATASSGLAVRPPRLHHQRESYLFFAIREYRGGIRKSDIMQPFVAGLSDQDMRDLAAYFSQDFPDRPPKPAADSPIYRTTSRECGFCHGETGIGELEGMPVLAGQDPEYIIHALASYRDGTRGDPTMRAEVKRIAPKDDDALARYYAQYGWLEHGQ